MHSRTVTVRNCPWTLASKGGARSVQGWSNVLENMLINKTRTTGSGARRRGGAPETVAPETRVMAAETRKPVLTSPIIVVITTTLEGAVDGSEIVTGSVTDSVTGSAERYEQCGV